jgi:hypothetical protein
VKKVVREPVVVPDTPSLPPTHKKKHKNKLEMAKESLRELVRMERGRSQAQ